MGAYAQLLTQRYRSKLDAEADQFLAFIIGAANRMSTLVRDLLAYARLTTEIERPSSIALDEDLEAALTHLKQAIDESGARVTHDPMPNLPVDRGQMVRLFQNLVGNAVKYRQANRPAEIHISAEARETEWTISIRDNGIGFDMKTRQPCSHRLSGCTRLRSILGRASVSQFASVSCRRKAGEFGPSRSQVKEQLSSSRYPLRPHRR